MNTGIPRLPGFHLKVGQFHCWWPPEPPVNEKVFCMQFQIESVIPMRPEPKGAPREIKSYKLISSSEMPRPGPRTALVEGLLYDTDAMMIFAPAGGQKSMVALHMATAIAKGSEFMGKPTTQRRVLFVDGELALHSWHERLEVFGRSDNLRIVSESGQDKSSLTKLKRICIDDESWQSDFIDTIQAGDYGAVVLDNFRTLTDGINENDASEITPLNSFVKRVRQLGCAVVAVHHTRKAEGDDGRSVYAGSSNFMTIYDTVIGIDRVGPNGITFNVTKDRGCSVSAYFREKSWELDMTPGGGYVEFDPFAAEMSSGLKLMREVDDGMYVNKAAIYRAARGVHNLSWSKGSSGDFKALFYLLRDMDAVEDDFVAFEERVKKGTALAKSRADGIQLSTEDDSDDF
jgi:hypothetical protein